MPISLTSQARGGPWVSGLFRLFNEKKGGYKEGLRTREEKWVANVNGRARRLIFALNISQEALLPYYERAAQVVAVKSPDDRHIQFPDGVLRRSVTGDGVRGIVEFEMEFDQNNKFVDMQHVGGE
jgi:hypothetical protein